MNASVWFQIANVVAMFGWLMLILSPRWVGTKWVVHRGLLPMSMGLLYVIVMVVSWGQAEGSFQSLEGVRSLFQNDWSLLMGWVHYLAFDMFVGSWMLRDSWTRRIPHLAMIPLLFSTFMFGPVGYLVYMVIASFRPAEDPEASLSERQGS